MYRLKGTMFIFLLISLMLLVSFTIPVHANNDPLKDLDDYIRKSMAEWQVPGLAIAVVKDDKVVFMKGYGVREIGNNAQVDEKTIFAIGSVTKPFTAHAVGILVHEGKVSWDDLVIKHLPWFRLPDPWVTQHVTIRDLLSHRVAGDIGASHWLLDYSGDRKQFLRKLRYLDPVEPRFRSQFEYCNICYFAAGEVVAAVSGLSWNDFVGSRIFKPLGMTSSSAGIDDLWDEKYLRSWDNYDTPIRKVSFENAKVQNIAMGHVSIDGKQRPIAWTNVDFPAPAASINTNAEDLTKWMRLLLENGVFLGKRLLSILVIREMHSGQVLISQSNPLIQFFNDISAPDLAHLWAYGLGWFITDYHGKKRVEHSGSIPPGFLSNIVMMPEERLGIAVLTNSGSFLPYILPLKVLDAYLDLPKKDRSGEILAREKTFEELSLKRQKAEEKKKEEGRVKGTKHLLPLSEYAGTYVYRSLFELKVTEESGALFLYDCSDLEWSLEHWHYDTFRAKPKSWQQRPVFIVFILDEAGHVSELKFRDVVFKRKKARSEENDRTHLE